MANKFQRSIQERLEQEAARQKRKKTSQPEQEAVVEPILPEEPALVKEKKTAKAAGAPSEEPQAPAAATAEPTSEPEKTAKPEPQPVKAKAPAKQKPAKPSAPVGVERYLRREDKRAAKNKTFYLDQSVIDAIRDTAQGQQVTESKLVNDILRGVLGVE